MSEDDAGQEMAEEFIKGRKYRGPNRREQQRSFDGEDQRGRRPRRGAASLIKWVAGAIIAAAATTTAIGTLGAYVPETRIHADEIHTATNKRVDIVDIDLASLKGDVGTLKKDVGGILYTGKKTQIIAIRSRLSEIQDRMLKVPPNSDIWRDYRREQIDLEEDLAALRQELGK